MTPSAVAAGAAAIDPFLPAVCAIRRVVRELPDTFTFELDPPGGALSFRPGQFNMLYAFGAGEVPISISGSAERPEVLVHTIRSVGWVTQALERLGPGDAIGVRGPYGSAWPVDDAAGGDLVVVAGGLGLAPLRPVVYHALAHRDAYRAVRLLVGARTPRDLLYASELRAWAERAEPEVEVTVDDAADTGWTGPVGFVTALLARVPLDPRRTTAMLCGPEVMMRFAARELVKRGVPERVIHLSLERNMQCAIALCGHCQLGHHLLCRDGAVLPLDRLAPFFGVREA